MKKLALFRLQQLNCFLIFRNLKALAYEINKRNFGLDLFRAIAVLAVVFGHGSDFIDVGIKSWFPVDGVDMFFVLSGKV